ncbi:hypothetical protein AAE485_15180 (plasmid) [Acidithiobacillus ferriphilus]|jgi:hypothetical protein|uniref:hypothetical protein n=2 Tax=Acidithiobacillaceae TaxID=225058 RepID=UPI0034E3CDDF
MKKTVLVAALTIAAPIMAFANTNPILAANNEVGVAVTGTLMNYQENVPAIYGPADTESGWRPGFAVKGSYMGNVFGIQNGYAAIHYDHSAGNIAYMGNVGGHSYIGTDNATTNRVMARVGVGINIPINGPGHQMMITPYIAGGYQSWNRALQGPYGYTEDYRAGLIGSGALFQYAVTPRFVVSGNSEILAVVGGGMTPHLNGLGSASFGTSAEEKVMAGVDYRISGPIHLFSEVSYTHFTYTGGTLKGGEEPSSATNLFAMEAGVAYSF